MSQVKEEQNLAIRSTETQSHSTLKATPGPWSISESHVPGYTRHISVIAKDRLAICDVDGAGSYNPKVLEYVRANAQLIAAAPALYEALVTLLDTETNLGGVSAITLLDAVDKARAALALAEGK